MLKAIYNPGDQVIYSVMFKPTEVVTVESVEPYRFTSSESGAEFDSHKYVLSNGAYALAYELIPYGDVEKDVRDIYYLMQTHFERVNISTIHYALEYDPETLRLYEVPHDENIPPREFMVSAYDVVNATRLKFNIQPKEEGSE